MLKKREEIKEILNLNITDEEKIEKLAKLNTITTDVSRMIAIDSIEDLNIEEGQIISNLGISWADLNKNCEYMLDDSMGNIDVVFNVNNISGYEVQYLNFDYLTCELGLEEEEAEEIEFDEVYQELLEVLGTDSDTIQEAEILVNNETEFIVEKISIDESINLVEIELKLK